MHALSTPLVLNHLIVLVVREYFANFAPLNPFSVSRIFVRESSTKVGICLFDVRSFVRLFANRYLRNGPANANA